MTVEATLLIEPGAGVGESQLAIIELDDTLNVDTAGKTKTSFRPGDLIYFRVHHSFDVAITDIIPTDGSVQFLGQVPRSQLDSFVFASREANSPPNHNLSKIPSNNLSIDYYGRSGTIDIVKAFNGVVTLQGDINQVPYLAKVGYNYRCDSYVLRTPSMTLAADETYEIVVIAYSELTSGDLDACSNS